MEVPARHLSKAIVCFPVRSDGISASRAGEGRCERARVYRWESSLLYFLLRFRAEHCSPSCQPWEGRSKAAACLESLLSATQGALSSKSVQVPAGRGGLLQTHGKIVPV